MHNVMEVRARVRLVVRGCEGDNILTVAVYASNEDVIHGHIYRVSFQCPRIELNLFL